MKIVKLDHFDYSLKNVNEGGLTNLLIFYKYLNFQLESNLSHARRNLRDIRIKLWFPMHLSNIKYILVWVVGIAQR